MVVIAIIGYLTASPCLATRLCRPGTAATLRSAAQSMAAPGTYRAKEGTYSSELVPGDGPTETGGALQGGGCLHLCHQRRH